MRRLSILRVFLEYFVCNRWNAHRHTSLGKRIREACEKLGPVFIKIGQLLSTRYDFFSERDCKELQKLLDRCKIIPYIIMKEIFKHDLGIYPEEAFEEFNAQPLASASLSQVYLARMPGGEKVAVKIRRPYIGRQIEKDMEFLIKLTRIAQLFSRFLRRAHAVTIAKEMKSWILEEINFEQEAKNIAAIRKAYHFCDEKNFAGGLPGVTFLFTYPLLCSKNVITMNYVDGVSLNNLDVIAENPEYNILLSIQSYLTASVHAFFTGKGEYLFQADPHPANILILKNGRAANIDCGLVGKISPEHLEKMKKLFLAVYSRNSEEVIKKVLNLSNARLPKNHQTFKKDIEEYLVRAPYEGIGFWFMEIVKICIKHRLPVPSYLNAFGRCNIALDGAVKSMNKSITTLDLIEKELQRSMQREIVHNFTQADYASFMYVLSEKARGFPQKAARIIARYSDEPENILKDVRKVVKIFKD